MALAAPLALLCLSCAADGTSSDGAGARPDLVSASGPPDLAPPPDFAGDPTFVVEYAPPATPFPWATDGQPEPREMHANVIREGSGYLRLDGIRPRADWLWIPNTHDQNDAGSVSKLDPKTVREVARYLSYTCSSLKGGSGAACDGMNGCCTLDDSDRFWARWNRMPQPGHTAVVRTGNLPSRTTIDVNGDLLVVNEAPGLVGSVTRIANWDFTCPDRNGNGRVDTSSDVDGDGRITTDCNGDGQPDDAASVLARPCDNGMAQEFYGLDDECVLWTTAVFAGNQRPRALSLSWGQNNVGNPWVGSRASGHFEQIDGTTGKIAQDVELPRLCTEAGSGTGPNGVAVDASGIAWVVPQGAGKLCWFDTAKPATAGVARDPDWGPVLADGVTLDRDQNVWVGGEVARYTPDRLKREFSKGAWTRLGGLTGTRIAADSRTANSYFVWSCGKDGVTGIAASAIKTMKLDQQVQNPGWPIIKMPCLGVAVDSNQNVWGVDGAFATRALVDKVGGITQPVVNGPRMGKSACPAGDSCAVDGADPYSDFAGFHLGGFVRPSGTYDVLIAGCRDGAGQPAATEWVSIAWEADVPTNTSLSIIARASSAGSFGDAAWSEAAWTLTEGAASPLDLPSTLTPNWTPEARSVANGWLWVNALFKTSAANAASRLQSLRVTYRCHR